MAVAPRTEWSPRPVGVAAGIWLPWALAPLWVSLPIVGCLVAGSLLRQPLVKVGNGEQPPVQRSDASPAAADTVEAALVRLVPVVPLATIEPR